MIKDLFEKNIQNWDSLLVISVVTIAIAVAVYFAIILLLRNLSHRKDNQLERNSWKKFRIPLIFFLLSVSFTIIIGEVDFEHQLITYARHVIKLLIIFGITWLLTRIISMGRDLILKQYNYNERDNLKARKVITQFRLIERVLIILIIIIAIGVALMTFESIRKFGVSIFASAGVAGIILGIAAQKLLGNMLAGIQIAIAQPIRIDDVVIVEGEWGWIEEINITYVVVRIWDKRRLILPTTYFVEKPFQNWTRESAEILGTVFIYTDYTVPFDKLREELTRILEEDDNWDGKVNVLQVTNATEKTVEIRALMSAADSPTAWDLRVNVREKLIEYLRDNYPQSLPRSRLLMERDYSEADLPSRESENSNGKAKNSSKKETSRQATRNKGKN